MRSTQLTAGALAATATYALIGLGLASPAGAATTTHEVGNVIECTATIKGRAVYASLYENNLHGNVIQVVIGKGDNQVGGSRQVAGGFIDHKQVHGSIVVGGRRAVIDGHASRRVKRTPVHEEYDDAGEHITVDGYHRKLAKDLTLTWRHRTVQLSCDNAFFYDLQVTREPIQD
ncbi:hypothetical protein [Nocardioides ungokensis]